MTTKKIRTTSGIEVKKRDKESIRSLLRRFNQRVRSSGVLVVARAKKYRINEPNRIARRKSALVRAKDRIKYQKERKMGRKVKK